MATIIKCYFVQNSQGNNCKMLSRFFHIVKGCLIHFIKIEETIQELATFVLNFCCKIFKTATTLKEFKNRKNNSLQIALKWFNTMGWPLLNSI